MKKNSITFSEDGSSFSFNFADGSEKLEIASKEAGIKAIIDLVKNAKISPREYEEFCEQILQAEELPWGETKKIQIVVGGFGLSLLNLLSQLSSDVPDQPVKTAYFKVCECGNHGKILCKKCMSGDIFCKEHGRFNLQRLKDENEISQEEFDKVKAEIENSSLPEEM